MTDTTQQRDTSRVVVMGGTSGIGEATARAFLRRGADVTVGGRDEARLAAALGRLPGAQGRVVDAADPASAGRFFAEVGGFDHLVLAASGGSGAGPLAALALAQLRAGFEAKLFAHLTALQAALPFVRASVTFVSAVSARVAMPGTAGLAAINGAIEAMVAPLASELAPVRVNAVSPGVIDTPWWDAMPGEQKEAYFRQAAQSLPVRRVGQPDDIAAAIVLMASNGFVTGSVLEVAGGLQLARG